MEVHFGFEDIARKYELSGASILNVIHFAALRSLSQNSQELSKDDIIDGIRGEFSKEDKFF